MSDIHDLHPPKNDEQASKRPKKDVPANEDSSAEVLKAKLQNLLSEHRDLDDAIHALVEKGTGDQLTLQRLKKRKLRLKDLIAQIEDRLTPDIIA